MSKSFRYGHYTLSTTARRQKVAGSLIKTTIVLLSVALIARNWAEAYGYLPAPAPNVRHQQP